MENSEQDSKKEFQQLDATQKAIFEQIKKNLTKLHPSKIDAVALMMRNCLRYAEGKELPSNISVLLVSSRQYLRLQDSLVSFLKKFGSEGEGKITLEEHITMAVSIGFAMGLFLPELDKVIDEITSWQHEKRKDDQQQ